MGRNPHLELRWIGKDARPRLEPRVLLEDPSLSYHASFRAPSVEHLDNLLVFGDNLLALKALEPQFRGTIKCVYIDPPYNTGAAFAHYDDGIAHSLWLSLMRERLELLRSLLRPDGALLISVDETEFAYLKDRTRSPAFVGGRTTAGKKYPLNNAGNKVRILTFPPSSVQFRCGDQVFMPQEMSEGNIITRLLDKFEIRKRKERQCLSARGGMALLSGKARCDHRVWRDDRHKQGSLPTKPRQGRRRTEEVEEPADGRSLRYGDL